MPPAESGTVLAVRNLSKSYLQGRWFWQPRFVVRALEHISLTFARGSTTALVGESGSGKSTLARCLALLEEPTNGIVWLEGTNVLALPETERRRARRQIQMIFQDPSTALNPRLRASEIVAEPLEILRWDTRRTRQERAVTLMEEVGLSADHRNRFPFELSGGQRQRLAIARALAMQPKVLILDEAFSGLDLPRQWAIIDVVLELRERWKLTYLLISHDLALVRSIAQEIAVLHQGRLVERSSAAELVGAPEHPQTRALVAASRLLRPVFAER